MYVCITVNANNMNEYMYVCMNDMYVCITVNANNMNVCMYT